MGFNERIVDAWEDASREQKNAGYANDEAYWNGRKDSYMYILINLGMWDFANGTPRNS